MKAKQLLIGIVFLYNSEISFLAGCEIVVFNDLQTKMFLSNAELGIAM